MTQVLWMLFVTLPVLAGGIIVVFVMGVCAGTCTAEEVTSSDCAVFPTRSLLRTQVCCLK